MISYTSPSPFPPHLPPSPLSPYPLFSFPLASPPLLPPSPLSLPPRPNPPILPPSLQLRVYQKLLTLQFSAVVQQNMRTLFIYHTFSSLKPLLSSARNMSVRSTAPEQAESGGMMKILGGVKLSVPMIEVLIQAVEGVRLIGEDIRGTRGKDVSSRPISISPSSLDVCSSNSSWQCLDMLLKYLPLLNDMFSLLVATFKKLQSHVS